jgi:NAD(P)-dependent dehydrogenase (short-subunit alcohol dehydrogenase family)
MEIAGKTFVISGGGSGLGAATAERLVAGGANVVLLDLNAETGAAMADKLGDSAVFVAGDVSKEEDVQAAVDAALSSFGALHGGISCAGIGAGIKTVGRGGVHPLAAFTKVIDVNLVGTFNVMRLVSAAICAGSERDGSERGVIINTASVAAFDGQVGQVAYAASKGAIAAMTLPAARDLSREGIRVMTIAPGLFDTPLLAGLPDAAKDSLGKQVPFPARLGNPVEFAQLAQQIIENQMLNGEVIRLDGAIRMAPR